MKLATSIIETKEFNFETRAAPLKDTRKEKKRDILL